ncbi:Sugar (and other) transporter [Ceratobasidium sp. AG-Ba]|nr:Sugar (and other) transporter [Ceratobasidium sp. AG-Ba]
MPSLANHVDLEKDIRLGTARTQSGSEDTSTKSSGDHTDMLSFDVSHKEIESHRLKMRGRKLTRLLAFVAGTGFTLIGYDQGVLSTLLTAQQFVKTFPTTSSITGPSNHATLQSLLVAIYEIGCLIGALSNTSTVPAYHAECAAPEKRGRLIMIGGSLITFGIMVSFFLKTSSVQWRTPIALQIVFALVMIFGIGFLPDSPRWLVNQGCYAEAIAVISALEDKPHTHPDVQRTFLAIREAALAENTASGDIKPNKLQLGELLHGGRSQNFRRATLGVAVQAFQQITGINLITYYGTLLFERLGIDGLKSRTLAACNGKYREINPDSLMANLLCLGTEYFLAGLIAIWLVERVGRRKLMLFGATGQCITMVLLAVLGSIAKPATDIVSAVLLFVFNSFFAVGWLGTGWLYPAEITPLRIRQPANALSTASNWTFNFVVAMIIGPAFQNIGYNTYTVFACLNAFIVPMVYFFFPETAGKSLEDMDVVFAQAYNEGVSPVTVSLRKDLPPAGSAEADEILGFGLRKRRDGTPQTLNTEAARPTHGKQC